MILIQVSDLEMFAKVDEDLGKRLKANLEGIKK